MLRLEGVLLNRLNAEPPLFRRPGAPLRGALRPLLLLALFLASQGLPAEVPEGATPAPPPPSEARKENLAPADPVAELEAFAAKHASFAPLVPGAYDGKIAVSTAYMLKRFHYYRRPLDAELVDRFLDRYLSMLDPMHIHFFKSDIEEFRRLRGRLADLTATRGDTTPAATLFARFLQRVDERVEYAAKTLRAPEFDFAGNDRYLPNRKDAEWPADEAEARILWRQHLRYEYLQEKLNREKPDQIIKTLANRYKRLLRSWAELDSEEILQVYLTALAQAYDPHSDYMGKAQLDNFAISMKLSLYGIGALLRSEDGYCKIESLMAGGPAARSKKIKPNDRIVAVAQKGEEPVDVVDMKLTRVVELIRGPKGTEVTLTIIPADAADPSQRKVLTLIRDEIKLEDQEAKARLIELPDAQGKTWRLGVIDLPSFYASFDLSGSRQIQLAKAEGRSDLKSTTADVTRLIKKLAAEGMQGLILDLRRNGGGSLEEAIRLTGLFVKEGPIVQVRDANGDITVESDPDPEVAYDGPLMVLTSRVSASASEILAAALQDYGRALIVGDSTTHGKGTVQTIYELAKLTRFPADFNPGALKVTIRKFYRANGWSTQRNGVTPDIVLPSVANYLEIGEAAQEYPLEWDTIDSTMYDKLDRIAPRLDELRRRSEVRQNASKDFAYIREDIETYQKFLRDKSVSLNEQVRLKEKEEQDARKKARQEERKARPESPAKIYEITLKNVDLAGLPEPLSSTNAQPAELEGEASSQTDALSGTSDDADADEDEEKTPAFDSHLEESKQILIDLIQLLAVAPRREPVTVSR
ncbi:MAG TPA: carboxy terminal-processing peptidase [Verrucomicrobiota bacterium]|nr:carboxy terminal-processing peptidase [Verrucomicrobiota bacterium]HNU50805.1 carboxy terminal-processing peptidase [Verrucomicrobiota bacterium]